MSGVHYFGLVERGNRSRFYKEYSETEFEQLLEEIDGELPKGIIAWHLEENEVHTRSKRVQAIAKLPIVKGPIGNWIEPSTHIKKMKADQARLAQLNHLSKS